jgi:hypothetical protein
MANWLVGLNLKSLANVLPCGLQTFHECKSF